MRKRIGNSLARFFIFSMITFNFAFNPLFHSGVAFAEDAGGGGGAAASGGDAGGGGSAGGGGPVAGTCDTPEGARMCATNEGLTKEATEVETSIAEVVTAAQAAVAAGAVVPGLTKLQQMQEAASSYAGKYNICVKTQNAASWICREKTNPKLQEGLNAINTVMSGMGSMAVNDSCSAMGKIMQLGNAALTGYTAACSAARATCEASCTAVMGSLKRIISLNTGPDIIACQPQIPLPASVTACQKLMALSAKLEKVHANTTKDSSIQNDKSTALKDKACTYAYTAMIASAGMGIVSLMKSMDQSSKCDKKSDGTSGGAPSAVASLADKCKDPANKNTPECLCLDNPRLPGCANSLQKAGQSVGGAIAQQSAPGGGGFNGKEATSASDLFGNQTSRDPASDNQNPNNNGSGGGAGAPSGGGGGGGLSGGGGGFGSGGGASGDAADKKGMNANIFGGAGGGGGGGGWRGGGSDSSDKANAAYRSYLPGGDKDPLKMSGQQNWNKEVTGQGGKSNWEKVQDRYRDNNATFLNK
jgi:uncharacterized membrane protein YgcG